MPNPETALKGVVHGSVIELDRDLGLPDGQPVSVTLEFATILPPGPIPDDLPRSERWLDRLVFDSSVLPGVRIVKGTNLAADSLLTEIEQGASDGALRQAYPQLTAQDVEALREYARVPDGIRRTAGAWAEDADELDEYLAWARQQRKVGRRELDE